MVLLTKIKMLHRKIKVELNDMECNSRGNNIHFPTHISYRGFTL